MDLNSIAKLIVDMHGSLQREIAEFRAEVNGRFDDLEKTVRRHDAGILAANIAVIGDFQEALKQVAAPAMRALHRKAAP